MATQQEVDSNWINHQNSVGAYDAGGTTEYQQGILTNAANLVTPGLSVSTVPAPAPAQNTTIVPEGYMSEAAQQSRYDQGVTQGTTDQGSATFQDYQSGSSDSDFLERVYNNETGRASDQWGKDYWQNELDSGKSREDIIAAFGGTSEGKGYDNPTAAPVASASPVVTPTAVVRSTPTSYNATKGSSVGYDAPGQAKTSGYDVTEQTLSAKDKSADTMLRMTAQDSPLMQQAAHQGVLQAASRGGQNSSLAAGASQAAMVKAAQPFALEDSGREFTAGRDYTNAQNREGEFEASAGNQASMQTNQQQDTAARFGATAENQVERDYAASVNTASRDNAAAANKASADYAAAVNSGNQQDADRALKASLADVEKELSTYTTDAQRATALDRIAADTLQMALGAGVFNDPVTAKGFFQTVGGMIPDLGIQVVVSAADQLPEGIIA